MSSGFTNIKYVFEGTNGVYRKTSKSKDLRALTPPLCLFKEGLIDMVAHACNSNIWEEGDRKVYSNSRSSSLHKEFS